MTCLRRISFLLVLLSTLAVAADSADSLQRANAAFENGDFDLAERLYTEAAFRNDDPGLVSFNRGVLSLRREQFREAELHFRRALEDSLIPELRKGRAWYNLGNSLLKQAGDSAPRLRSAVGCYENALDAMAEGDPLREDARYNLELAKLLWSKANAKSPRPNSPEEEPPERQPTPKKEEEPRPTEDPRAEKGVGKGKEKDSKGIEKEGKAKETNEKRQSPGAGRLPVLKDQSTVQPMPPEDTRAALKRIEERLTFERLNSRKELVGPARDRDW